MRKLIAVLLAGAVALAGGACTASRTSCTNGVCVVTNPDDGKVIPFPTKNAKPGPTPPPGVVIPFPSRKPMATDGKREHNVSFHVSYANAGVEAAAHWTVGKRIERTERLRGGTWDQYSTGQTGEVATLEVIPNTSREALGFLQCTIRVDGRLGINQVGLPAYMHRNYPHDKDSPDAPESGICFVQAVLQ